MRLPSAGRKVSALAAVVAGLIVFVYVHTVTSSVEARVYAGRRVVRVVVPAVTIPGYTRIRPSMLRSRTFVTSDMHESAIRHASEAVGKMALVPLYAGEQIIRHRLDGSGKHKASRLVSPGKVAMGLDVGSEGGAVRGIGTGDRVDILAAYVESEAEPKREVFENVLVIGKGSDKPFTTDKEQAPDGTDSTIIIEVSRDQARDIAYAQDTGNVRVLLRAWGEAKTGVGGE